MQRLELKMAKVKDVVASHEHSDHIKGLRVLAKKYSLPVFITKPTLQNGRLFLDKHLIVSYTAKEPVTIGELVITAFSKLHDAADPYSFVVSCRGINIGVFTDIGTACENLVQHFSTCHAAFLESNYDEHMLEVGGYPYYLKKRISGEKGHLSNKQAMELFTAHRPKYMSHLVLSHLSKNNNCPKLVGELFTGCANGVQIVVASREQETEVYKIEATRETETKPSLSFGMQMQLFA